MHGVPDEILIKFCEEAEKAGFLWQKSDINDWAYAIGKKNQTQVFTVAVLESPDMYGQVMSNFTTSMYIPDQEFYSCQECHGTGTIDEGPTHNWECSSCEGTGMKMEEPSNV